MKVYLGTDHRGFELKEKLKTWLMSEGHEVEDMGARALDPNDDYPDFVIPVAQAVLQDPSQRRGIILGHSGQGEAMAANRFAGVRAAVYYGGPEEIIILSRQHNDANILSLGSSFIDETIAKRAVALWLATSFSQEERHQRRIGKIDSAKNHG